MPSFPLVPRQGIKPVSLALADGFLTTGPPVKSLSVSLKTAPQPVERGFLSCPTAAAVHAGGDSSAFPEARPVCIPSPRNGRRCEGLPHSPPPRGIPGKARSAFPGPNPPPYPPERRWPALPSWPPRNIGGLREGLTLKAGDKRGPPAPRSRLSKRAVRGPNVGTKARVGSREGLGSEQGHGGVKKNSAASRAAFGVRGRPRAAPWPFATGSRTGGKKKGPARERGLVPAGAPE